MSEKLEVGSIFQGKVLRIKPFGVIVTLPEKGQGLVHISHISTSYVQNIADYVSVGDMVQVKVLSIDQATGKVSLSMKDAKSGAKDPRPARNTAAAHSGGAPAVPEDAAPEPPVRQSFGASSNSTFEDKFKEWLKISNERQAGLNKRNKRK